MIWTSFGNFLNKSESQKEEDDDEEEEEEEEQQLWPLYNLGFAAGNIYEMISIKGNKIGTNKTGQ